MLPRCPPSGTCRGQFLPVWCSPEGSTRLGASLLLATLLEPLSGTGTAAWAPRAALSKSADFCPFSLLSSPCNQGAWAPLTPPSQRALQPLKHLRCPSFRLGCFWGLTPNTKTVHKNTKTHGIRPLAASKLLPAARGSSRGISGHPAPCAWHGSGEPRTPHAQSTAPFSISNFAG